LTYLERLTAPTIRKEKRVASTRKKIVSRKNVASSGKRKR
jgi:hypothetical protein